MIDGPLGGAGVLITRPVQQSAALQEAVEKAGGNAILFPAIDIVPRTTAAIAADLKALPRADIVIFISANAVHHGIAHIRADAPRIAAIGPATKAALDIAGVTADIIPGGSTDSEHLLATAALQNIAGLRITIVRGGSGRDLLAETLRGRGALVEYLSAYERQTHVPSTSELTEADNACQQGMVQAVMIMSSASLESLLEILPANCQAQLQKTRLVAPSTRVIQTALERIPGLAGILAPGPGALDMTGALIASLQTDSDTDNG
jgi:uroporphyrinogen-III synthase